MRNAALAVLFLWCAWFGVLVYVSVFEPAQSWERVDQ
jgi:hypothetical protein